MKKFYYTYILYTVKIRLMDNVTHTLVGIDLANAFFRKRVGRESVWVLAAASNVTDIDAVVHLSGHRTAILMRRTFGHSLFMVPIWAFLLAWLFRRRYPHLPWKTLLGLCLLGIGLHLFFDLVNSFGVVLLWPFSDFRPELSIIFIIDLILMGLLAAPLLLCAIPRIRPHLERLSRAAVVCVAAYILFCGVSRRLALRSLERSAGPLNSDSFVYAFPEPLGPHRWRGVVRTDHTYHVYLIHSLTGLVEERGRVETQVGTPMVETVRRTALARRLEWFFKAPVWTVDGDVVSVYDLRFRSLTLQRNGIFSYRFLVHPDGRAEFMKS